MIDPPKTIGEAREYWKPYAWIGVTYNDSRCAYKVNNRWDQCPRKNGHGIGGLYCKQHALIVERMMKK